MGDLSKYERVPVTKDNTAILRMTLKDPLTGSAKDLSAAVGSLYFNARTIGGVAVTTDGAASWTTDGSDGKIEFQLTSTEVGTVRTLICDFEVQGFSGQNLVTDPFLLDVEPRAKVS